MNLQQKLILYFRRLHHAGLRSRLSLQSVCESRNINSSYPIWVYEKNDGIFRRAPKAKEKGYSPGSCHFIADYVKAGRPYPWMCYRNATELNSVFPNYLIIEVGDTVTDMQEGKNAGCGQ